MVLGGQFNQFSIAVGMKAKALHAHSMVINLQGNQQFVESTAAGQFLVQAKEFKFQVVTSDPGPDNDNVLFLINADNIELVQVAIDIYTPPERKLRRVLRSEQVLRREEDERDRARRNRKVQAIREHHGLN